MTPPSTGAQDQYHYTDHGVAKGPVTVGQLKELARTGHIRPETLIWKQGFPAWLPARSLQGLLPPPQAAPPATPKFTPPQRAPVLPAGPTATRGADLLPTPSARLGVLVAVIAGAVLLLGGAAALLIVLLISNPDEARKADSDHKNHGGAHRDADLTIKEKPENATNNNDLPPEFKITELLELYGDDPSKTLRDLNGKTIILKVEGNWKVEKLESCIRNGNVEIFFFKTAERDLNKLAPRDVMQLIFPLRNTEDKLGFFAKVKARMEKLKPNEQVIWTLKGILGTLKVGQTTFMVLKDAVLVS